MNASQPELDRRLPEPVRPSSAPGRWARAGFAITPLCLFLLACGAPAPTTSRPVIVTTVPPLQFIVEQLVDEPVRVVSLLPPSANPTTHAPTIADREALAAASLVVTVGHPGFPFEQTWLGRLLAERPDLETVPATSPGHESEDPHVWTDPEVVLGLAERLQPALKRRWPEESTRFATLHQEFAAEVGRLQQEMKSLLEPVRSRSFFVFHPAWGHLAQAHGLTQVALEHDHKEPGPHAFSELVAHARAEKARVIFAQPQFNPAAAEILATEIGGRVETLDPLAYDWFANMRLTAARLAEALAP